MPLRRAIMMWESGEWLNPNFFNYPSLTLYLNEAIVIVYCKLGVAMRVFANQEEAWFQLMTDPTSVVLLSRSVNIFAEIATMLGVWKITRPSGPVATLVALAIVAFSGTMLTQSRLVIVEPIMTALLIWAIDRMICFHESGRAHFLIQAIVLGGLATGAKYNAGLVVFPLVYLATLHFRQRTILWSLILVGGCFFVFLASSPFVLLDWAGFYRGFRFEAEHMSAGHFGSVGKFGAIFVMKLLSKDLMFLGIPLLLVWVWNTGRRLFAPVLPDGLIFTIFFPLLISTMVFRMEASRYLMPVIPLAAMGTGLQLQSWLFNPDEGAISNFRQKILLLVVVLVSGLVLGFHAARSGELTTQILAREWIEANLDNDSIMLTEEYGPKLFSDSRKRKILNNNKCRSVRPELLRQFASKPTFKVISIPFSVSGTMAVKDPRTGKKIPLYSHVSDFNGCFYNPEIFVGVNFFITSGGVRQRNMDDPSRYPNQNAFYSWLDSNAILEKLFSPGGNISGPEIRIYSLPQQGLRIQSEEPNDIPWWGVTIRSELVESIGQMGGIFKRELFVKNLAEFFQDRIMPFLLQMARFDFETKQYELASFNAKQVLEALPSQRIAVALVCRSQLAMGQPYAALRMIDKVLALADEHPTETQLGWLLIERANINQWMGNRDEAKEDLKAIIGMESTSAELRQMAQNMWRKME